MIERRAIVGILFVGGFALATGWALAPRGGGRVPAGNAVVVLNTGGRGLDSIAVTADPPGAHPIAGASGYLASRDSVTIRLPAGAGDAAVRVWRDGRLVADHLAYFGGRSWFEVRVGDTAQAARYRRTR